MYISAIVGAGFATGQEILSFFTKYGFIGFLGIFISITILAGTGVIVIRKALRHDVNDLCDIAEMRFGKVGALATRVFLVFLQFSVFSVMLSGMKTILCEFGISAIVASSLLSGTALLIISADIGRVIKVNGLITPFVIIGISFVCIMLLIKTTPEIGFVENIVRIRSLEITERKDWFISAILYGFFNAVLAVPVLCSMKDVLNETKQPGKNALWGIGAGVGAIGVMALLVNLVLYQNLGESNGSQMPIIGLAEKYFGKFGGIYQILIFAAMAGSFIICGKCSVDLLGRKAFIKGHGKRAEFIKAMIICVVAIPVSLVDFSGLMNILYPFFGALGILAIVLIVC